MEEGVEGLYRSLELGFLGPDSLELEQLQVGFQGQLSMKE